MRRRDLVLAAGCTVALSVATRAQQKAIPVVGFLSGRSATESAALVAAFRQGLGETGNREDRNIRIEYRWAEGHYDRLPALAADLVRRAVDVIASPAGIPPTLAAKAATSVIPIVFVGGGDPVALGLVDSLARPGGNLTGISLLTVELNTKRLQLLAELVPQTGVIALLVNPTNSNAERIIEEVKEAAHVRHVQLHILKGGNESEIDAAFAALPRQQPNAMLVGTDPYFTSRREQLVALAAHYAVPTIYDASESATAGGLISYGPSLTAAYRQAGVYVGTILKGAKPADLPVQQPTKFELVINLKTAKALGLTVPQSILARADEVIE